MCGRAGKDSAVVDVHVKIAVRPRAVDEFEKRECENSGEDRGEGGALRSAVVKRDGVGGIAR